MSFCYYSLLELVMMMIETWLLRNINSTIMSAIIIFYSSGFYDEAVVLLNKAIKEEKNEKGLYINRGG